MKKLLLILLIVTFAASMTFMGIGCKTTTTAETTAAEITAAETTAAETAAAETTAAAGGYKYTFYHLLWDMTDPNVKWHIANGAAFMKVNKEVEVKYVGPEKYDPAEHAKYMDTILAAKPDAISLHISDINTLLPSLEAAKAAGIPVMSITSHPSDPDGKLKGLILPCWVGADETLIGTVIGERLLQDLPKPKHVVYTIATPGHAGHEMRAAGFFESMPAGTKTTKLATGEDPEKFKDVLRSFLTQNTDVDAIFTFTMCNKWIVDVLQEMNLLGKIKLLTADESPSSLEGILQGYYLATFSQEFAIQGQLAYNTMYLYKETGMCPIQPLITGPAVVDMSNAQKLKDLAIGALGQDKYDELSPFGK